jgi:hypothetical protein
MRSAKRWRPDVRRPKYIDIPPEAEARGLRSYGERQPLPKLLAAELFLVIFVDEQQLLVFLQVFFNILILPLHLSFMCAAFIIEIGNLYIECFCRLIQFSDILDPDILSLQLFNLRKHRPHIIVWIAIGSKPLQHNCIDCLLDDPNLVNIGSRGRGDDARKFLWIILDDVVAEAMKGIDVHFIRLTVDDFSEFAAHGIDAGFGESKCKNISCSGVGALENVCNAERQD